MVLNYLLKIGYRTNETIDLKFTKISIDLGNHYYRDDGIVHSLNDHKLKFYLELSSMYKSKLDEGFLETKKRLGGLLLFAGYSLSNNPSIRGYIMNKSIGYFDFPEKKALYLFAGGHEEAHVLQKTGNEHLLEDWFSDRGFSNAFSLYNLYDEEFGADIVGVILCLSKGIEIEPIYKYVGDEIELVKHI